MYEASSSWHQRSPPSHPHPFHVLTLVSFRFSLPHSSFALHACSAFYAPISSLHVWSLPLFVTFPLVAFFPLLVSSTFSPYSILRIQSLAPYLFLYLHLPSSFPFLASSVFYVPFSGRRISLFSGVLCFIDAESLLPEWPPCMVYRRAALN